MSASGPDPDALRHRGIDPAVPDVPDATDAPDARPDPRPGDPEAFRTLYDAHHRRILGYLRGLVGESDAEDIASETWVRIYRALPTFHRHRGDFRAWSTAIARNQAISHLRYRRAHPAMPVPAETFPQYPDPADTEHDATEAVLTAQVLTWVLDLPPGQASAVLLCAVIGMDATMAARILRKQPSAVRTALHRGLRTLRQRLRPAGGGGGDARRSHGGERLQAPKEAWPNGPPAR